MSCSDRKERVRFNYDAAVFVLEKEKRPIGTYDVQRGIEREFGWNISLASLTATLASDPRCCWAGSSIYGLCRHGLYPGARTVAGVGKLFLYSRGAPIRPELLSFAMQFAGYRFQEASLMNALRGDPDVVWTGWDGWAIEKSSRSRSILRGLRVAPSLAGVDEVAEQCANVIREAETAYHHRLKS